MTGRHVSDRLTAFVDGQLASAEASQISAHLAACEPCRRALEHHQFTVAVLRELPLVQAPPRIWTSIETRHARPAASRVGWIVSPRLAYVAAAVAIFTAVGLWSIARQPRPWDVLRVDSGNTRLAAGDWVETPGGSTARLRIGEIGTVDVAAGSRMQLVSAGPEAHRLNLAHGRISAEIVAPPRIFFVETPASTVVDLGCAYTMEVDQEGVGMLRVTGGWAALEWGDRTSLVPAGASAPTRPRLGPGTPSFDDATERLREALLDVDFGTSSGRALDVILSEARERDTLTLWHLMSRVAVDNRARVFDRIVALTPLPANVERGQVMALEPDAMRRWREELAWTW